ncbi:YMR134W-like protein [Saccharomyces cerevisiae Vin13]|nr:YMR134W-like protein [Saccharomyces cerevisiae Vin13]
MNITVKNTKTRKAVLLLKSSKIAISFFAKPVFVSELDVECNVIVDGKELLSTPLKFHVEFSPEDYENEKRPEFGTTLRVLRLRLYHYFKDCEIYRDIIKNEGGEGARKFTISNGVKNLQS